MRSTILILLDSSTLTNPTTSFSFFTLIFSDEALGATSLGGAFYFSVSASERFSSFSSQRSTPPYFASTHLFSLESSQSVGVFESAVRPYTPPPLLSFHIFFLHTCDLPLPLTSALK